PWLTGWDEPVDLVGDSHFDRGGGQLTLTVPGKGHDLHSSNAPHLLRDVEGDFIMQVRVGGDFLPIDGGYRSAGILLLSCKKRVTLELGGHVAFGQPSHYLYAKWRLLAEPQGRRRAVVA